MNGRHELYGEDGFAELAVDVNAYQTGDTWYRDMRSPGFNGELATSSDNSVQWLAKRIVADKRFADATVKFWWPAIMGSEVAEPPEDEGDADFEGAAARRERPRRRGDPAGPTDSGAASGSRAAYNLKDLLVEMVLSKWFRADAVEDANPVRRMLPCAIQAPEATPHTGGASDRKTAALTGYQSVGDGLALHVGRAIGVQTSA